MSTAWLGPPLSLVHQFNAPLQTLQGLHLMEEENGFLDRFLGF